MKKKARSGPPTVTRGHQASLGRYWIDREILEQAHGNVLGYDEDESRSAKEPLIRVLPVGDLTLGERLLSRHESYFLGQAVMWHQVAWRLGRKAGIAEEDLDRHFSGWTAAWHVACVRDLFGTRSSPAPERTQAAVIVIVRDQDADLWRKIPTARRRGRPGATIPIADVFVGVPHETERLRMLHSEVLSIYRRTYGNDVWKSGAGLERVCEADKFDTRQDATVRSLLTRHGVQIKELNSDRDFYSRVFSLSPQLGALLIAWDNARRSGMYHGGFRVFCDAYRRQTGAKGAAR